MTDLFRDEAVREQRQKLVGTILLAQRWPATLAVATLCAAVALGVAGFFTLGFARTETVAGQIQPGEGGVAVVAPQGGVVAERRVAEGQRVAAGDVLFTVASDRVTAGGETGQRVERQIAERRRALQAELAQGEAEAKAAAARLAALGADLRRQLEHAQAEIDVQARRVELAEAVRAQFDQLSATQDVATTTLRERAGEALAQRARLAELRREHEEVQAQLTQARLVHDETRLRLQREALGLRRTLAELEQEEAELDARRALWVRAPRDGVVVSLAAQPGQALEAGQPLALVLPEGVPMVAELYVPTRAVGLLRAGLPVQLRYEAFPFERFGQFEGRLREVSLAPLVGEEARRAAQVLRGGAPGAAPGSSEAVLYRVRVDLPAQGVPSGGQLVPLRAGMRLAATLRLEERRLSQWAFQPLAELAGRSL